MPVKLGVNPLRLHCLFKALDARIRPVEFGCKSIEIDASQIGWKFIEITLYACLVKFGGHNLSGFPPNSTSQIRPGINYWSNWVEIR